MGTIDIINYFLGIIFIILGFAVSNNPNLIAGYNTMTNEKRRNFNITSFKHFLKTTLIAAGFFVIVGNFLFFLISWDAGKVFISVLPGLVLPIFLIYKSKKKYTKQDGGRPTLSLVILFTVIFILLMAGFFLYAPKEPDISVQNEEFNISGFYGITIPVKDIKSIVLSDTMPKILIRTNGLGLGSIKKGNFKLENEGICKLYLQDHDSPYIKITYSNHKLIYLNFKDKDKTTMIFNELLNKITSNTINR